MHSFTTAARAPQPAAGQAAWQALDEPGEWQAFSRGLAGTPAAWESFLSIEGMHCAACSLKVEEALRATPGVRAVEVSAASSIARIEWMPTAGKPSHWFSALQQAGYSGLPAGDMLAAGPRLRAQRLLVWRWLVAGFCMMQVMMYAVPAYVAAPGEITPDIEALLRWASWTLTLPVMLFSCAPFFRSAWRDVRRLRPGMDVPVALGIAIAFAASTVATYEPAGILGRDVWFDSITMFVFFLLSGRLLEQRVRDRTAGSLERLMRRMPQTVLLRGADGQFVPAAVRKIRRGDVIRILAGEVIPADGRVLEGESQVDEALLTGESRPVPRKAASQVIAGSHNLSGSLTIEVEQAGDGTRYAGIVALMEQASIQKPRLAELADRIASPFLLLVLLASAGAAAWWWAAGPGHAIGVAVAVLIVTCPCALSLATPSATLAAAGALARRGILVRRIAALETCADVDTVIFDKTGTLTESRATASVALVRAGADRDLVVRMASALAGHSRHPASVAIAAGFQHGDWSAHRVTEVPGQGVTGTVGCPGAAARVLRIGSAAFCNAWESRRASGSQVYVADEQGWLATLDVNDALRSDAPAVMDELRSQGLQVQLLSGDHRQEVTRVAGVLGVESAFSQQSPEDKLAHIQRLQAAGRRVMMIGDGMNDGPTLARADVSVAMGDAVPIAQAKSDFVIQGSHLAAVAALLRQSRRTRRIVRQNLAWAALYNATCVPLAVMGAMPPWLAGLGMACSSLVVVMNSARLARLTGAST